MRLAGKRAIITAAASGMGRAGCELVRMWDATRQPTTAREHASMMKHT